MIIAKIRELRSLGMSDDLIADRLFVLGYESADIEAAFAELDAAKPRVAEPKAAAIAPTMPWRLIFVAGLAGFVLFTKAGKRLMKKVTG